MTTQDQQTTANTILNQLGGNRFLAMTGAKNLGFAANANGEAYLSFKFPTSKKLNYCKITHTVMDEYKMEFFYLRGLNQPKNHVEIERVGCEKLQEIFTSKTGLYTRL